MSKPSKINRTRLAKTSSTIKKGSMGDAKLDTNTIDVIEDFLSSKDKPQKFGDIAKYLAEHDNPYPNYKKDRSGLSHSLLKLIKQKRIKKLTVDKNHKYPRYVSNSKTIFESAFDGYLFRNETVGVMFRNMARDFDDNFDPKKMDFFVKPENKVKTLVNYLGVQMLDTILSSYVRPINSKETVKSNRKYREVWLKNALSYHEPDIGIIEMFERVIINNNDKEVFENKSLLKDVNLMKKSLRKIYPNITEHIDSYDGYSEELKDAMRDTYLTNKRLAPKIIE